MRDETTTMNNFAPLRNVSALSALIERVKGRAYGLPGMACFYGPSGFGKSIAATWCTNKHNAIHVEVKSFWTARKLCEAILVELSVEPKGSVADMIDAICDRLGLNDTPLIIDEADLLIRRGIIELTRHIYEGSQVPVILIGEERMPQDLQKLERIHGRMFGWVEAVKGTRADIDLLARLYARGIEVDAALKDVIDTFSRGSVRRICVNLDLIKECALELGVERVGIAEWGDRAFYSGIAPAPRRMT